VKQKWKGIFEYDIYNKRSEFGHVKTDTEIIIRTEGNSIRNALDKPAITDSVKGKNFKIIHEEFNVEQVCTQVTQFSRVYSWNNKKLSLNRSTAYDHFSTSSSNVELRIYLISL
jgi:hypothetical protein